MFNSSSTHNQPNRNQPKRPSPDQCINKPVPPQSGILSNKRASTWMNDKGMLSEGSQSQEVKYCMIFN